MWSVAVLQHPSDNVLMYLNRAVRAREHSQHCAAATERAFYQRMEASWMNLAASTASVERVDLFLHTLDGAILPYDMCGDCSGLMVIETIESLPHEETYTFACRACGSLRQRTRLK